MSEPRPAARETQLLLQPKVEELQRVSALIDELAQQHGWPTEAVFDINVVVEEVLTNVIFYARPPDGRAESLSIDLRATVEAGTLTLRLEDNGQPFDPLAAKPPDLDVSLEERKVGGLGIVLMRELMSTLTYERRGDRNVLLMTKSLGAVGS